ncbi:hypothetical protein H4R33_004607 [Dimargaris cristalligena]|nr:hypothetical protein H4R33_004607 [Dimargaris cristalligena]
MASPLVVNETVELLLGRYLSREATLEANLPHVIATVTHGSLLAQLARTSTTTTTPSALLTRWSQRVTTLVQGKTAAQRWCGIVLLDATLQQTAAVQFPDWGAKWLTPLLAQLAKTDLTEIHALTLTCVTHLLQVALTQPDWRREAAQNQVPRLLQTILAHLDDTPAGLTVPLLQTVTTLAPLYASTFRPFADKLAARCVPYLNGQRDPESAVVAQAGQCLAVLTHAGGRHANQTTMSSTEKWRQYGLGLVGSSHRTLDQLLEDVVQEPFCDRYTGTTLPGLDSASHHNDQDDKKAGPSSTTVSPFPGLVSRLLALGKALGWLWTSETPAPVQLPVGLVLGLATRLANLGPHLERKAHCDKVDFGILMSLIPDLNHLALELTVTVLTTASHYAVAHLNLLGNIACSLLNRGSQSSFTRLAIYSMVATLTSQYGTGLTRLLSKDFYARLFEDVKGHADLLSSSAHGRTSTNSETQISFSAKRGGGGGGGGKRRRGPTGGALIPDQVNSPATLVRPATGSAEVQLRALELASELVMAAGNQLPLAFRLQLIQTTVGQLLQAQLQGTYLGDPQLVIAEGRGEAVARIIQLHRLLLTLIRYPAIDHVHILPHAIAIFQAGLFAPIVAVQVLCRRALATCDILIHPRLPALPRAQRNPATESVLETSGSSNGMEDWKVLDPELEAGAGAEEANMVIGGSSTDLASNETLPPPTTTIQPTSSVGRNSEPEPMTVDSPSTHLPGIAGDDDSISRAIHKTSDSGTKSRTAIPTSAVAPLPPARSAAPTGPAGMTPNQNDDDESDVELPGIVDESSDDDN